MVMTELREGMTETSEAKSSEILGSQEADSTLGKAKAEVSGEPKSVFDKLFPEGDSSRRNMAKQIMEKLEDEQVVTDAQSEEWASVSIGSLLYRYSSEELARLSNEGIEKMIVSLLDPVTQIIQALKGK